MKNELSCICYHTRQLTTESSSASPSFHQAHPLARRKGKSSLLLLSWRQKTFQGLVLHRSSPHLWTPWARTLPSIKAAAPSFKFMNDLTKATFFWSLLYISLLTKRYIVASCRNLLSSVLLPVNGFGINSMTSFPDEAIVSVGEFRDKLWSLLLKSSSSVVGLGWRFSDFGWFNSDGCLIVYSQNVI